MRSDQVRSTTNVYLPQLPVQAPIQGRAVGGLTPILQLVLQLVEVLRPVAVDVEPPVADEVLLAEEGPVGAEEAVHGETVLWKPSCSADVEC